MKQFSYMEEFESEVEDVFQALWADYLDMTEQMGDRPYGFLAGDRWQQAEQYLELRDSAEAWEAQIQEWSGTYGRETAEIMAVSEQTRMEKLIAEMGGYEAVRIGIFARRLRAVEPAMQSMRRALDAPKAQILDPLPPLSDLDLMARLTSLGEVG